MAELTFIPFDGRDDSSKKRKKREVVRAQVMKNFHRQRRRKVAERRNSPAWEAGDGCSGQTDQTSTILSEAPTQVDLQGTYESIYDDLNSAADYIPDYSLACLHSDRGLLPSLLISPYIDQHIKDVEGSSALLSANPKSSPLSTDWLPASRTHPYLYHASVFVCLASTETLAQQPLSPSSYYHRGVAINLINERLGDPINCCTDETIAAIISLANFECITGNISNLKHHVDGMLQLVDMRGGLDNLGMNGLLKKLIEIYIWFLEVFSPESSPLPPPMLPFLPPGLPLPPHKRPYTSFYHLLTLEPSSTAAPPHDARSPLYTVLKSTFAQPLTAYPSTAITSGLSALDLSTLPPALPPNLEYIPRTCRLATLMYHSGFTCENAYSSTKIFTLRDYLVQSDMSTLWAPFSGALLWCLIVGAECARGHDVLYSWFAAQLMRCWVPLAMNRWEGLEAALDWFGRLVREQRKPGDVQGDNDLGGG